MFLKGAVLRLFRRYIVYLLISVGPLSASAQARGGGETSGGGGIVQTDAGTTLWDFYGLNYDRVPSEAPYSTRALQAYGIDQFSNVYPQTFSSLRQKLRERADKGEQVAMKLLGSLISTPIFYIQKSSGERAFAISPQRLQRFGWTRETHPVRLAGVYHRNFGTFIFSEAQSLDQAGLEGLLIHELIRNLQGGHIRHFTDAHLEELTRVIAFQRDLPSWVAERFDTLGFSQLAEDQLRSLLNDRFCKLQPPRSLSFRDQQVLQIRLSEICQASRSGQYGSDLLALQETFSQQFLAIAHRYRVPRATDIQNFRMALLRIYGESSQMQLNGLVRDRSLPETNEIVQRLQTLFLSCQRMTCSNHSEVSTFVDQLMANVRLISSEP